MGPLLLLRIITANRHLINALIFLAFLKSPWQITGVYGPPRYTGRKSFFENLLRIKDTFDCPWGCLGDFNSFLNKDEKKCGRKLPASNSILFNKFIDRASLIDLGFFGYPYT